MDEIQQLKKEIENLWDVLNSRTDHLDSCIAKISSNLNSLERKVEYDCLYEISAIKNDLSSLEREVNYLKR